MIAHGLVGCCRLRHHARMAETTIHPTAIVDTNARLGEGVHVAAYAVIGAGVEVGDHCVIGPHAVLEGPLQLGPRNIISAHATLGLPPQDNGYQGEPTRLEIGADNQLREFVTLHRASTKEDGVTRLGNRNLLMAYSHVGHDGQLGDDITISNASQLAGHVHVADRAYISAVCGIHQFVHIGTLAMVGGGAVVTQDVAPFCTVTGNRARLRGLNSRGMERAGMDADSRRLIRRCYQVIFRSGMKLDEALHEIAADPGLQHPAASQMIDFIRASDRGVIR